jgi:hypothetical protein
MREIAFEVGQARLLQWSGTNGVKNLQSRYPVAKTNAQEFLIVHARCNSRSRGKGDRTILETGSHFTSFLSSLNLRVTPSHVAISSSLLVKAGIHQPAWTSIREVSVPVPVS